MLDQFSRTTLLLGKEKMQILFDSKVAVFGIGGVGGYTVEALARSGVGSIDIFDDDKVCVTNINRQIIATHSTVGQEKVQVMKERVLDINPKANVSAFSVFYGPDTADKIDLSVYDYVVDAVDTVTAKLELICRCRDANVPIISCMGAANKMDPTAFEVTDIYSTSICPLARVMRRELKKRNIPSLKVVYSKEPAMTHIGEAGCAKGCVCPPGAARSCTDRRQIPASISFVPPVVGLIAASEAIKSLLSFEKESKQRKL